jgi:anti-sigma B factor antagonist
MSTSGPVIVMQLPEQLKREEVGPFLEELQPLLESDRPRVVLDCSQVRHMDSAGVEMLLRCMQEAMKRDGDLKLAAVSPESGVIMELMRVDRLFEVFNTPDEAVQSFQGLPAASVQQREPWYDSAYPALGDLEAAS